MRIKVYILHKHTNGTWSISTHRLHRRDGILVWVRINFFDHKSNPIIENILMVGRAVALSVHGNSGRDRETAIAIAKQVSEKVSVPYIGDLENEIEFYKDGDL